MWVFTVIVALFNEQVGNHAVIQIIQIGGFQADLEAAEKENGGVVGPLRRPYSFFALDSGFCCDM